MRVGVVHQFVAALDDGLGLLGVLVRPVADDEKGSRNMMLFQSRQDRRGIAIFVTTVKSQINHFLISVSGIVGIIFF